MGLTQQLRFWMFLFDEWPSLAENNARNGMNLLMPSLLNYTSSFQAGAFVALATRQWATDTTGWTIRRPQLPTKLLLQGKCDNVRRRNRHKFIICKYVDRCYGSPLYQLYKWNWSACSYESLRFCVSMYKILHHIISKSTWQSLPFTVRLWQHMCHSHTPATNVG